MTKRKPRRPVTIPLAPAMRRKIDNHMRRLNEQRKPAKQQLPAAKPSDAPDHPMSIEAWVKGIKRRLEQSDLKRRDELDAMVHDCFSGARRLQAGRINQICFGGRWAKLWLRKKDDPSIALKFIFREVLVNEKRSSFYYRATRKMYEDGVPLDQLSTLITKGGGFQQLANDGAKPRQSQLQDVPENDENDEGDEDANGDSREDDNPAGTVDGKQLRSDRTDDRPVCQDDGEPVLIRARLGKKGDSFSKLPMPCRAVVEMDLKRLRDGTIQAIIIAARKFKS